MKQIQASTIANTIKDLFLEACIAPPEDVNQAILLAHEKESSPIGKEVLRQLIENNVIAKNEGIPSCQDTGMAVVFLQIGQDVHVEGDLRNAVNEGVRQAYQEGYFRKSVLTPLLRGNTNDNTPAVIHFEIVSGDALTITVTPKGFGSENMSQIKMLKPSDGVCGVKQFLVDATKAASGNPCPPVILGVGIGGTFEYAAYMAKKQLLREVGSENPDLRLAKLEQEVKDEINALSMGPMGMGGSTYCLAVHIEEYPTHLAALPVAVNFCCHALRHATRVL